MSETISYFLEHANATVEMALTDGRFIVKTQGRGLADKLRTIDIPLSDLKNFGLIPTIGIQHVVGKTGYETIKDNSYDSEFIFSYLDNGKPKSKRVFVNSFDQMFQRILEGLKSRRPDASLLHLAPADAQKQIGVVSGRTAVFIIIGLIVAVPVLIVLIMLISTILRR